MNHTQTDRPLSPAATSILRLLYDDAERTADEIAAALCLPIGTVQAGMAELERRGFVEADPSRGA